MPFRLPRPAPTAPGAPSTVSARDALRDVVPVVIGYATLGLAAGMLLVAEGLSWWWAPLWSVVIYSGTMQMLLAPLAGSGEPLAAIATTTAFVSSRHVFYGLGFPLNRVRGGALARFYAVHTITDEVYALLASKDRTAMTSRYILTIEAVSHVSWTLGTAAGALAGTGLAALIGGNITLLGFVLTSLFVVLAIENWRSHPDPAVLVIGVLAGAVGMTVGGVGRPAQRSGRAVGGARRALLPAPLLYCRRRCSTSGPAARRAVSGAPGTDPAEPGASGTDHESGRAR